VGSRGVLVVTDVLAPGDGGALLVGLVHRNVCHEPRRCRAVPVVLARFEEDAVARADDLDRAATPLAEAYAFEYPDRLAVRMRVPSRARAGREVDARRSDAGHALRRGNGVDEDRTGEPVAWTGRGFERVPRDLHACLLFRSRSLVRHALSSGWRT